jgi:hypothetical protein
MRFNALLLLILFSISGCTGTTRPGDFAPDQLRWLQNHADKIN